MGWRNSEATVGDEGSYLPASRHHNAIYSQHSPDNFDPLKGPFAIDPITGQPERLGRGRTAVIGREGVRRVVRQVAFEPDGDVLDRVVATDELTHGA